MGLVLKMEMDYESTLEAYHMVNELNIEVENMLSKTFRKVS